VNEAEAETLRKIFQTYMESASLSDCRLRLMDKGINGKSWTTNKGEAKGGSPMGTSSIQRLLRSQLYTGKIANKRSKDVFDGQHQAIISQEQFNAAQQKLDDNNNHPGSGYQTNTALLHNKIMTANGEVFKNRAGKKENGLKKYRYYRAGKTSLPAGDIDNIVTDTIKKFLDSDMGTLPAAMRTELKQVEYSKDIIQPMVDKIIYHDRKLTLFINVADLGYLVSFKKEGFMNTVAEPMKYHMTDDGKQIVIETPVYIASRTCINHRCDGGEVSVLTKSENTQLLTKALAYGWRYKKQYENGTPIDEIRINEHRAERTVYKYLNLAYLSPHIINDILSGEVPPHVNLQTLFKIAEKYDTFADQEREFLR
jgi:hypothetical protein